MSDPSRFNSPSRKSRFRAQGHGRPSPYSREERVAEETPVEELAVADETGTFQEHDPATLPAEDPAAYLPAEDPAAYEAAGEAAGDGTYAEEAPVGEDGDDHIPAALRLTRPSDSLIPVRRGLAGGLIALLVVAALALGGLSGYLYGNSRGKSTILRAAQTAEASKAAPPISLDPEIQVAIDTAFTNTKVGKYEDARKTFEGIYAKHPEWPSMEIEAARAALYQRDFESTTALLAKATRERPMADAAFLSALVHLTAQEFETADTSFASAAAIDPARADIYYFWGENLRREGKPLQAADKFKAALVRNQYENVESLYQLKYWLSLVQADQDGPSGEGAKIDASLSSPHPAGAALFAGAARAVKAGQYKEAAGLIAKAQAITDPSVFKVILNDPTFLEANLRPELADFYK